MEHPLSLVVIGMIDEFFNFNLLLTLVCTQHVSKINWSQASLLERVSALSAKQANRHLPVLKIIITTIFPFSSWSLSEAIEVVCCRSRKLTFKSAEGSHLSSRLFGDFWPWHECSYWVLAAHPDFCKHGWSHLTAKSSVWRKKNDIFEICCHFWCPICFCANCLITKIRNWFVKTFNKPHQQDMSNC